ncbi:unnamed protein product [Didymodactylos carnosus]|uniref:Asn/Gln amidotransferase domain-containing protein n=1 Tax=Didymodactylos carnosus TaxID=1234261 RepID=A0A8S2D871_9BILA|nr:unnamed protein product [Didymodactylos carnosus]CAF3646403.1 unnamed protein product [Didymodactylos carnosus]
MPLGSSLESAMTQATLNELAKMHQGLLTKEINSRQAKEVAQEIIIKKLTYDQAVTKGGHQQITEASEISDFVDEVIQQYTTEIQKMKDNRSRLVSFLIGKIMVLSKGQANPQLLAKEINLRLDLLFLK